MQQLIGFFCVILAGIGFGFLGIFGRLAFNTGMSVGELLTFRFLVAGLLLGAGLFIFQFRLLKLNLRQLIISTLLGLLGYAVFSSLYFISIKGLSVSLAAMLLFTFPLFVNLAAHFILKQKMTSKQFASLILAFVGMIILLWGPVFFDSLISILFALAAAATYAIYVLVSGQYQQGVHPLSSSFYVITSAGIGLFLFHQPSLDLIQKLSMQQWSYIFGLAIVCTILPISLFLLGLQKLSSGVASIVVMIEPVVAAIAAWMILDEKLKPFQYVGMALVFLALVLNAVQKKKN